MLFPNLRSTKFSLPNRSADVKLVLRGFKLSQVQISERCVRSIITVELINELKQTDLAVVTMKQKFPHSSALISKLDNTHPRNLVNSLLKLLSQGFTHKMATSLTNNANKKNNDEIKSLELSFIFVLECTYFRFQVDIYFSQFVLHHVLRKLFIKFFCSSAFKKINILLRLFKTEAYKFNINI